MKRMMHPQHGWHHPTNSYEREEMLKNGWRDEDEFEHVMADPSIQPGGGEPAPETFTTHASPLTTGRRKPGPKPKAK